MYRLFLKIVCVLPILFVSCNQNGVKETVKNFYFAYQNLDFETAKIYCNPSMEKKIELIEAGFNQRTGEQGVKEIRTTKISVKKVKYNADKTTATVTVEFHKKNEKDEVREITDKVFLEKRNGEWKIADF